MAVGRPKAFDETEALEAAMQMFWAGGYEATPLAALLSGMKISRQSLYDTFGSKRGLFTRSILHYRSTQLGQALAILDRKGSALKNVKAVVRFFERLAADERCRGCFVANALVEIAPHDPEIAALLHETLDVLQDALYRALERAQREGEISDKKSPLALSRALTNAMIGMAVTGKLNRSTTSLRDVYSGTLAMLD